MPLNAQGSRIPPLALGLSAIATAACAHVKWFEKYEVAADPVPITTTLALAPFWFAMALVTVLFLATTILERKAPGQVATRLLDKGVRLLRDNADAFMIAVMAAFFIALFAVGGSYLTPDLKTDSELLPWAQLLIAILLIWRRTRPVAAVMILGLWLVALGNYDLFHLYDYLALGLGLAGYVFLSGLKDGDWRDQRFAVLRWGIALALMWSSMEKFMYPQWFMPLLEAKPFLAFGIPFEPYTTMAGVAEFTLGFGLLWTSLVRRLSAIALFALMFSAVYPFGRVDMIGHATILAALLVAIADPLRDKAWQLAPRDRRATWLVPVGLASALAITMLSYAGQHYLIYRVIEGPLASLLRPESRDPAAQAGVAPGGFWRSKEHYHGRPGVTSAPEAGASAALIESMERTHVQTGELQISGDLDQDFVALMIPHHQSGVDMSRVYLESGADPELRRLAAQIISSQEAEIALMRREAGPLAAANAHHPGH